MKTFLQFFAYFPYILQGVVVVQQVAGSAAAGSDKKALVLAGIQAAASVGEGIPEAHVAGISTMIDLIVAALNKTNLAGFGTPAAPTV